MKGKSPRPGMGETHTQAQVSATDLLGDLQQITSPSPPQVPHLLSPKTHVIGIEGDVKGHIRLYVLDQGKAPRRGSHRPRRTAGDVVDTLLQTHHPAVSREVSQLFQLKSKPVLYKHGPVHRSNHPCVRWATCPPGPACWAMNINNGPFLVGEGTGSRLVLPEQRTGR